MTIATHNNYVTNISMILLSIRKISKDDRKLRVRSKSTKKIQPFELCWLLKVPKVTKMLKAK